MRRSISVSFLASIVFVSSVFAISAVSFAASKEGKLTEGMTNPGYHEKPKWFKLSFLDIREDIKEAADAKKRVVLYFYQDGCPYCAKLLQDNFGQKAITDKTRKHFDVVAINMWGNKEVTDFNGKMTDEKQFAQGLKVHFTPTMLFLNEQGKVVYRLNGYYFPAKFGALLDYIAQKQEDKLTFSEFFKKLAPEKASAKLTFEPNFIKPPYDFQKILQKDKKPLLVFFEQPSCKSCDEMHKDILQRKRSKEEMNKLSVGLVDIWSNDKIVTPDGKTMTAKQWAKQLKINYSPSLVFFDASGKEVFRTEAYLKSFHIQGAMAYVHEKAYIKYNNFQRYLQARREKFEKQGEKVDLMK